MLLTAWPITRAQRSLRLAPRVRGAQEGDKVGHHPGDHCGCRPAQARHYPRRRSSSGSGPLTPARDSDGVRSQPAHPPPPQPRPLRTLFISCCTASTQRDYTRRKESSARCPAIAEVQIGIRPALASSATFPNGPHPVLSMRLLLQMLANTQYTSGARGVYSLHT